MTGAPPKDCVQMDNVTNVQTSSDNSQQYTTNVALFTQNDPKTTSDYESLVTLTTTDTNDKKIESSIISSCVLPQSDLLQLEYLVQAGELQYINQTLKDISEKLVDDFYRKRCAFPEFVQNCLTPIVYFLKRLQNLDDFMNLLTFKYQRTRQKSDYQLRETTNLSLRMILHVLFMSSDVFLQRVIMTLVSKRNPVPFVSPNILNCNENDHYEVMPAIIHVWNHARPNILSFGIGPCKGKSTLLNQLFRSTFEQTTDSIYFQQTIDIDFGYSFNPERTINIADTHGAINKKLLQKIQPLFDGFLIQISKTYLDQQSNGLLEYIENLPAEKFQMIIIRDTSNQSSHECSSKINKLLEQSDSLLSQNLHIYPLADISNTNDRNTTFAIEDLRQEMLRKIKEEVKATNDKDNISLSFQKLVKNDYLNYLKKIDKIIQPLTRRLLQKNEYHSGQNFPLYLKFQKLCKLRQKLKKLDFYGSEGGSMFDIYKELDELETELNPQMMTASSIKCGHVFDLFIEILKSDNMLMSLDLLASELKSELSGLGGDKIAGDLVVEHAFLSLEVLWRNSIVCYDHTTSDTQNLITKSYCEFVEAGFPFEIIDGDNFHFQHQFLTRILSKFDSKKILVISIIGPQNSGKSTLLNYMFGTLFDVREGRCTRGIYGSLVKLAKSNQTSKSTLKKVLNTDISDIDYIMLIDTEGLLSIEKSDKEYDRRLVLFSLAVSHLVIVNMMGDINETLRDMLTLCADSLKQIGVNTTNQPIVHFVLNQKADPNLKNHMEAIGKIIEDLKEKKLAEVIDISPKTFHTLPSAFKKERVSTDTKSPCFIRTEPDFIERTQELCEKIIESAKGSYDRTVKVFSDPPQWLRTAINIFDTLQKFPDLTYFKDINERRQDDQIQKAIGDLIAKKLPATHREKIIEDTCHLTEKEIRKKFQAQFDIHQNDFDNDLENLFKVTSASDRIRDRCGQFLKRQLTEICNAWCTAAIQVHDQKQMEDLVRDGSADLRNLIDDIIKKGSTMTKENAKQEFEVMWDRKIESIENDFKPEECLEQAITFVYGNYNIFEKKALPSHEVVLNQLPFFHNLIRTSSFEEISILIGKFFVDSLLKLRQNALEQSWKTTDTTSVHTLATLQNFKYLDKKILSGMYTAVTVTQESYTMNAPGSEEEWYRKEKPESSWFNKGLNVLKKGVGYKPSPKTSSESSTTNNSIPLRFDFVSTVHQTIVEDINSDPRTKSNILNIPELFNRIIADVRAILGGNGTICRPIEIDLVQKIVGLINTYVNEINLELLVFRLLLSQQVKSSLHVSILILLTIHYFHEQNNHFTQQLSILRKEKDSLLNYFISMVVPDAECDKDGAELFANKVKSTIQLNLIRDGQKIITRVVETQKNLTRKHIQTICDGKLYAAAEKDDSSLTRNSGNNLLSSTDSHRGSWLIRYITAPTDIIEEEFKELWRAVEQTIDQQLMKEKNNWRSVLHEFFARIEYMKISLLNEGSSVQYIDDIFEASGGAAADNLKNKGQCMGSLLLTYLSGNRITCGTSYTVFDQTYTLRPKGVKLFEKLPIPNLSLTTFMNGIRGGDTINTNQTVITSIKNLHFFLESIMNVKNTIEQSYDNTLATFAKFDKDQNYIKLLDKARGCTSKCPCCQRPCDVDHTVIKSNPGISTEEFSFFSLNIEYNHAFLMN